MKATGVREGCHQTQPIICRPWQPPPSPHALRPPRSPGDTPPPAGGAPYDAPRRSIWVVMERMEGSLLDILQAGQPFPEGVLFF